MIFSSPNAVNGEVVTARTWADVNLAAIAHNVRALKNHFGSDVDLMAVVKSNGYGLGAVEVAGTALEAGATGLVVATFEEGLQLREAGLVDCQILVLGFVPLCQLGDLVKANLSLTVNEPEVARILSEEATRQNTTATVQLKLETGLHRNGLKPEQALEMACYISNLPNLTLEGVYTHFANGDEPDRKFVFEQFEHFRKTCALLAENDFNLSMEHVSNSATGIGIPQVRGKCVRVGLAMLGYYPSDTISKEASLANLQLNPCLSLKSSITRLHWIDKDDTVGYGRTFKAEEPMLLALVPVGYADGYRRALSNRAEVLVRGKRAMVLGRVNMDQITLDVTGIPDVQLGDEVVLIGEQGEENVTLDEIAALCDTISYEILTGLGNRVKRVYKRM